MKYSYDYSKLYHPRYTTIRRYSKGYKVGDIITETYPSGEHKAEIEHIAKETLHSMPIEFLQKDTIISGQETPRREEIYLLFQSFYGKPIDFEKEKFTIYYLKRV